MTSQLGLLVSGRGRGIGLTYRHATLLGTVELTAVHFGHRRRLPSTIGSRHYFSTSCTTTTSSSSRLPWLALRGGSAADNDSSSYKKMSSSFRGSSRALDLQQQRRHMMSRSKKKRSLSSMEEDSMFPTNLQVSVSSEQGHRTYMEDEHVVAQDFCAVFDGHGGPAVSLYLKQNLFAHLQAALPSVMAQKEKGKLRNNENENEKQEVVPKEAEELDPADVVSETAAVTLPTTPDEPTVTDYCIALRIALDKVDQEVQRISHWSFQGSTAVAAWLHYNSTKRNNNDTSEKANDESSTKATTTETTLIVANIGDSRAIYGCNGTAIPLTRDHKPDDPKETARIKAVGGSVVWCGPVHKDTGKPITSQGVYRVNGNLALSRAIGDRSERPAVTAEPDIVFLQVLKDEDHATSSPQQTKETSDDRPAPAASDQETQTQQQQQQQPPLTTQEPSNRKEYVVLATDGLWDVMTNQEVVDIVDTLLDKTKGELKHLRPRIADVIVREALRRGTWDNVTVILIWLRTGDEE
jgi:serine/threonine protein phosphatase PrpC